LGQARAAVAGPARASVFPFPLCVADAWDPPVSDRSRLPFFFLRPTSLSSFSDSNRWFDLLPSLVSSASGL
jgi:hypothetical protein